jgi:hypothetical protein
MLQVALVGIREYGDPLVPGAASTSPLNFIRSRGISRLAGGRIPSEQDFLRAPQC